MRSRPGIRTVGLGLAALCLVASMAESARGEDSLLRVEGARVGVHREASDASEVAAYLDADTRVMLIERRGEWCEILGFDTNAHGFVRCRALGAAAAEPGAAPTIDAAGAAAARAAEPVARFWDDPSVERLLAAGEHFEETRLDAAQLARERGLAHDFTFDENRPPVVARDRIGEFEAMKRRLRDGVVADRRSLPGFIRWTELQRAAADAVGRRRGQNFQGRWFSDEILVLLNQGAMRPVGASLFRSPAELGPPRDPLERLGARFGIRHRAEVVGGPAWVYVRHEGPLVAGSWDIGILEQFLDEPVVETVVGREGQLAAVHWQPRLRRDLGHEVQDYCEEGLAFAPRGGTPMPGYPRVDEPLIWLFTDRALPARRAEIKPYARRLSDTGTDLLVIYEIDLDGDRIADLAAWEILGDWRMEHDPARKTRLGARVFFANIAGDWVFLDYAEHGECA